MQVTELLSAGKISLEDYEVFMIFDQSELGRKYLSRMIETTFQEEPNPTIATGVIFSYMDGRRSIFRNIKRAINNIYQLMRESENVSRK